jgi:homoserine dehydrogenase
MAKIAVLGHGVVGSGVCEVIQSNSLSITKKTGEEISVKKILDLREFNELDYKDKFTKSFDEILNDDEISVVVEVMGGLTPAYDFVKACLQKCKSVVTSNKELVAQKGADLLAIAKQNGVNFFFEASVGGGIPIIRPMHLCLAANEIEEIAGILNGTTNFILTKMINEQMSFEVALTMAQELGYAERSPEADVEGHDACRKICILASLAFGKHIYPEFVHTEGITKITLDDVEYAKIWGGVIKLIGRAKKVDDKVEIMVSPAIIPNSSQLSSIDDVFNGVLVRGNATGDVVFYGKGAGKLPTASAVVADIVHAVKLGHTSKSLTWEDGTGDLVSDYKQGQVDFYVRCIGKKENLEKEFDKFKFLQRDNKENEFAFTTGVIKESELDTIIEKIEKSGVEVVSSIRILNY